MIRKVVLTILLMAGAPGLFAQEDEAEARRRAAAEAELRARQERAAMEADRRAREEADQRMREFLRDVSVDIRTAAERSAGLREADRRRKAEKFRLSVQELELTNEDFRETLGFHKSLKRHGRVLEKNVEVLLDYVRVLTDRRVKLDTSEFKNIKRDELEWEALTTAERLLPQLQAVLNTDGDTIVDIRFLSSLSVLETDLLRLQWMARRLK